MITKKSRNASRIKRHYRIRNKISGTPECPRVSVFISLKAVYVQIIDDVNGKTLVSASTKDSEIKTKGKNIAACQEVGKLIAEKAKKANITKVVFDRSGYLYHGKVKALADGARSKGLEF